MASRVLGMMRKPTCTALLAIGMPPTSRPTMAPRAILRGMTLLCCTPDASLSSIRCCTRERGRGGCEGWEVERLVGWVDG